VIAALQVEEQQLPLGTRTELRAVVPAAGVDLGPVAEAWQRSLDTAQWALEAARAPLGSTVVNARQRDLALERQAARQLLARLGRESGARALPWLSPWPLDVGMLGLPQGIRACLFDLDGVLTDSGALHAWAWAEVFDPLLLRLSERLGWAFRPFDRASDYRDFVDGRPRLDGIHAFLASRGITFPEGRIEDPATADTAHGLARRKGDKLAQGLADRGVVALDGARRYLEAARRTNVGCGVVSASTTMRPMLELAGLARLVDVRADAELMRGESLRARPAPDLVLAACRRLGIAAADAATMTQSPAGVAAGRSAGLFVIGVGDGARGEELREFGADSVVPSLSSLLDPRIREDGADR
jgi:beta-phosphoglucomutase-like phosphatase (HAD superfamily)